MTTPNIPTLANLPYSAAIKKAQAEVDKLYSDWVDEDEILQDLNHDFKAAQNAYAVEFKKAAIAGAPIPDESSTQEIEKKISYQLIRCRHAKTQCEEAGRQLALLVKEKKREVITLAIAKARNGVELWRKDVTEIASRQMEASQARREALDGVRMLSNWGLTDEIYRFDPNFPLVGEFTVPSKQETRLLGFLDVLENAFREAPKEAKEAKA